MTHWTRMSASVTMILIALLALTAGCTEPAGDGLAPHSLLDIGPDDLQDYRHEVRQAVGAMWTIPNDLAPDSEAYYEELFRTEVAHSRMLSLVELGLSEELAWKRVYQTPYLELRTGEDGEPVLANIYAARYAFLIDEATANSIAYRATQISEPEREIMLAKLAILQEELSAVSLPDALSSDSPIAYRARVRRAWAVVMDEELTIRPGSTSLNPFYLAYPPWAVVFVEDEAETLQRFAEAFEGTPASDIAAEYLTHAAENAPLAATRERYARSQFLNQEMGENIAIWGDENATDQQRADAFAKLVIIGQEAERYREDWWDT
jgi:hypothetical protein